MAALTPKQASVLAMIDRHIRRYGHAPSVREIAEKTGRSRTAAQAIIVQLEKRGKIRKESYSHRTIEVL